MRSSFISFRSSATGKRSTEDDADSTLLRYIETIESCADLNETSRTPVTQPDIAQGIKFNIQYHQDPEACGFLPSGSW